MTKQGWIKRFDKEIYPELKGYGTKAVAFLIKQFISQELSTFAKEVEEILGIDWDEDERGKKYLSIGHIHQALTKLKKEKGIK